MKKFKMNMILGKRQIILACLVVALGIAVYLNWNFAQSGEDLQLSGMFSSGEDVQDVKNYGDAQFVVKPQEEGVSASEYFEQARLERTQARDAAMDNLETILKDANLDNSQKENLAKQVALLTKSTETETRIENQIRAKGFNDCMAYMSDDKISVIVQTEGLDKAQAAQIKNILIDETNVLPENISITEVK